MNGKAWSIWAVSLLGDVCSVVYVDSYVPENVGEPRDRGQNAGGSGPIVVTLTANSDTVYSYDFFRLHVNIEDPSSALELNVNSCPLMMMLSRASDGSTSLQETSGYCRITSIPNKPGRFISLDVPRLASAEQGETAEQRVQLYAVLGSPHAPRVAMVGSNILHLRAFDLATIPRTWGPSSGGLAISLSLDRRTYVIGEDIPLRMFLKNVSADADIASGELPCFAGLSFEVRSDSGQTETSGAMVCSGHGFLIHYPKGEEIPATGITLQGFSLLPNRPGKYTVTASWNALAINQDQVGTNLNGPPIFAAAPIPYAVVHSAPAQFEVTSQR